MKKLLSVAILLASSFILSHASCPISPKTNDSELVVIAAANEEFVDSVEAQNAKGTETKYFNVYGRRQANGKYWYFVKYSTREFGIQYADNNRYKPFYIKINGERWYFASQRLDLYTGKTDQW